MKKIPYKLFIYLTAFILFTGAAVHAQGKLINTNWKLVEANGVAVTQTSAAIEINADGTKFTGSTGCNRMFGDLTISAKKIEFRNVATTKRMCKLMAGDVVENTFLEALSHAKTFQKNRKTLRLLDSKGVVVLRFAQVVGQPAPLRLEDDKWVLEQIKGRQTFVPLPYAFLNFDAKKGSIGGNSGCNLFGGSYDQNYGSIEFSGVISTMRACAEDNKMSVERDMLDGLQNANRFEIKNGRLFLYDSCDLLLTFRGEKK